VAEVGIPRKVRNVQDVENIIKAKIPAVYQNIRNHRPVKIEVASPSEYPILKRYEGFYEEEPIRKIVIKKGEPASTVLHEYGHFVDFSLTGTTLSRSGKWQEIFKVSKTHKSFFFLNRIRWVFGLYYMNSKEFFAECFARYYLSVFYRNYLRNNFPEAHEYLKRLEERAPRLVIHSLVERVLHNIFGNRKPRS